MTTTTSKPAEAVVRHGRPRARLAICGLAVLLTSALTACGPPRPPEGATKVVVVFVDSRGRRLPFEPEAMRATRAREALDRVAREGGAGVAFAVDLALLPDDREGREAYLADAMESLARALDELRRKAPADFAASVAGLAEVSFRYDPLAHRVRAKLSTDGRTLEAHTAHPGSPPLQSGDYTHLLRERARELASARYRGRTPDDVPPAERAAYLETLTGSRDAPRDPAGESKHHAQRLLHMLRLHALAARDHDDALAAKVRRVLATSGDEVFRDVAFHHPELLDGPDGATLRRAEAELSRFLAQELAALDEDEALAAVRAGFLRASPRDAKVPRYVLPSFDRVGVAIALLRAWRARGGEDAGATPALHAAICPEERVRSGNRVAVSRSGHCGEELYQLARTDRAARQALAEYARRADDAAFTRLFFARLARDREHLAGALEAARSLQGTRLFQVAIDAIAGAVEGSGDPALVADARDLARSAPAARGDVAYLVARALTYRGSEETFTRFADLFGGPLELADFERFMAYGDAAVQAAPAVIPAFAKGARGAPRMRVFLTKLDAYLDGAEERRGQRGPDATFSTLRERLCADEDAAGVAELARAFAERRRKRPGEALTDVFSQPCPRAVTPPRGAPAKPGAKTRPRDGGAESDQPLPKAVGPTRTTP